MRVGVLASGSGTNLQAMLEHGIPVVVVIADRPCGALDVAREAGVAVELIERDDFGPGFDRLAYTHRVVDARRPRRRADRDGRLRHDPRQADPRRLPGRILNTHPALLPAFKGWHAVPPRSPRV